MSNGLHSISSSIAGKKKQKRKKNFFVSKILTTAKMGDASPSHARNGVQFPNWLNIHKLQSACHRCNLALCALAQVAAMGSANLLHLNGTKTSKKKF